MSADEVYRRLQESGSFDKDGLKDAHKALNKPSFVPRMPTRIFALDRTKVTLSQDDLWVLQTPLGDKAIKLNKTPLTLNWAKINPGAFVALDEGTKAMLVRLLLARGPFKMSWFEAAGKGWHAKLDTLSAMALWFSGYTASDEDLTGEVLRLCNPESIKTLAEFAGGIFTRDRVTVVLKRLLDNYHKVWGDRRSDAEQRTQAKLMMIEVGTSVVAAYFNSHKRLLHLKTQANDDAFKAKVEQNKQRLLEEMRRRPGQKSSAVDVMAEAIQAGKFVHKDMMSIYLQSLADFWGSPLIDQARIDLHTIFIAAGARWADYAHKQGETRQKRATAGTSLFFALAGFIPIVGQFAGLVSWVANQGVTALLDPYDGTKVFAKLQAEWLVTIGANYPAGRETDATTAKDSQRDIFDNAANSPWGKPNYGMWARLVSALTSMTRSTDHI